MALVSDIPRVQRRTLGLLFSTQILGGMGTAIGIAVGGLLAARLGGTAVSGFASSAMVIGAALLAVPISKIMSRYGRRYGLGFAYLAGTVGAVVVVLATAHSSVPLMFLGLAAFGGGTAAGLQARYTAVDLAAPSRRGRDLSLVVWATTIGAVAAPNFAGSADAAAGRFGLPELAGPFAFSAVAFVLAAIVVTFLLRPDPLLLARQLGAAPGGPAPGGSGPAPGGSGAAPGGSGAAASASGSAVASGVSGPASGSAVASGGSVPAPASGGSPSAPGGSAVAPASGSPVAAASDAVGSSAEPATASSGSPASSGSGGSSSGGSVKAGWRAVSASPAARLGVSAVAVGHVVMVGVMSMTPVHIDMGPSHGDVLRIVGLVLSVHILGMYALSPITGWLTDRLGRRPVILAGTGLLVLACAVAGTADHRVGWLTVGLFLLGLGWSCTMVAGSTLLSESVPVDVRPAAQGLSDLAMGVAGAAAGAVSGLVVEVSGYQVLNILAATAVVPLVALALRPVRTPSLGV